MDALATRLGLDRLTQPARLTAGPTGATASVGRLPFWSMTSAGPAVTAAWSSLLP